MLNMSSPNTGADAALGYSHRVANEIFRSQEIEGFPYFRLNLVDGGNDLREVPPARSPRPAVPDVLVHTTHVTLYWGEAGHPVTSSTCETLTGIGGEGLDGMQVGRIILGSRIGSVALASMPDRHTAAIREFSESLGPHKERLWSVICGRNKLPVGLYQLGRVIKTPNNRTLPLDSQVAFLWLPALYEPDKILEGMQSSIRRGAS